MTDHYENSMEWVVHRDGPVATVKFEAVRKPLADFLEHHISAALALEEVRFDDSVRVIVITGRDDGTLFELGPERGDTTPWHTKVLNPATRPGGVGALKGPWSLTQGIERTFAALALMEKPVVGRLNGDAYGFALHMMWGCDIVVAREDVILGDSHLAMHPVMPAAMAAGDGAFAFLPLFMTPVRLKEFLLLGRTLTGAQAAEFGMVNCAVSADDLDAKVDEYVKAFLARPPVPVMRTKRAIHKRFVEQMNLALDYSWMAESIDHWEGAALDFEQQYTLRHDEPAWSPYSNGEAKA